MLENIQVREGSPFFLDVQILINSVPASELRRVLEELHDLSLSRVNNWSPSMRYPYTRRFELLEQVQDVLTGFGRVIEFECLSKNEKGEFDPTIDSSSNQILQVQEGKFTKGLADGFQRQLHPSGPTGKIGYFKEGHPYGKYLEIDRAGVYSRGPGIFSGETCLREGDFDSFEENLEPGNICCETHKGEEEKGGFFDNLGIGNVGFVDLIRYADDDEIAEIESIFD